VSETSTKPPRRPKPAGGKRTANRFAKLAGGDSSAEADRGRGGDEGPTTDGLIGGMSAVAVSEAHRVVEVAVAEVIPHPFNDSARSRPKPGDAKWEELLNGVRANGVRLPVLAVPREAFVAARPAMAEGLDPSARFVLIYGHRRRAAALEAGRLTMPAVIDEAIMADDGDLDAMAAENLGREDLSDLAEAALFARYADLGLTQRAIAERLGVDQATISRRLALLLLAPEVSEAVANGTLPSAEAAALSGKLPYGPLRGWQRYQDPDQLSEARRREQLEALRWFREHGWPASRAAERVIAERDARAEATSLGVVVVADPSVELGEHYADRRIDRAEFTAGSADEVVAAINSGTGRLDLFRRAAPPPLPPATAVREEDRDDVDEVLAESDGDRVVGAETGPPSLDATADPSAGQETARAERRRAEVAATQAQRRQAGAALAALRPTTAELLALLVRQYESGVAARSHTSAVAALLRAWGVPDAGRGEKGRQDRAWQRAIASAEVHTADSVPTGWDQDAVAYLHLLIERVGYRPADWERDRLEAAVS
jgi:ParB family chromosome partitioning protein